MHRLHQHIVFMKHLPDLLAQLRLLFNRWYIHAQILRDVRWIRPPRKLCACSPGKRDRMAKVSHGVLFLFAWSGCFVCGLGLTL